MDKHTKSLWKPTRFFEESEGYLIFEQYGKRIRLSPWPHLRAEMTDAESRGPWEPAAVGLNLHNDWITLLGEPRSLQDRSEEYLSWLFDKIPSYIQPPDAVVLEHIKTLNSGGFYDSAYLKKSKRALLSCTQHMLRVGMGRSQHIPEEDRIKNPRPRVKKWLASVRSDIRAHALFMLSIPDEMRRIIGEYCDFQWPLLLIAAHCRGGWEMIRDNPGLAMLVVEESFRNRWVPEQALEQAGALLKMKRRLIAARYGFPNKSWVVNMLAKVDPANMASTRLRHLSKICACERHNRKQVKILRHISRINLKVVELLTNEVFEPVINTSLVESYIPGPSNREYRDLDEDYQLALLKDLLRMLRLLERSPADFRLRGQDDVQRLHDQLTGGINTNRSILSEPRDAEGNYLPFPPPPFAGTDTIIPIRTVNELIAEGREMSNCAATYGAPVRGGHYYLYKVEAPERATLSLYHKDSRSPWCISQLLKSHNSPVSRATRAAVNAWLQESQGLEETVPTQQEMKLE